MEILTVLIACTTSQEDDTAPEQAQALTENMPIDLQPGV